MCLSIEDGCSQDDTNVALRQEEEFYMNDFLDIGKGKCVCERTKMIRKMELKGDSDMVVLVSE